MRGPWGAPQAITAAAHKLARRVYYALKYGMPYVKQTQEQYEALMRARQIKALERRARQLGLELRAPSKAQEETAMPGP